MGAVSYFSADNEEDLLEVTTKEDVLEAGPWELAVKPELTRALLDVDCSDPG